MNNLLLTLLAVIITAGAAVGGYWLQQAGDGMDSDPVPASKSATAGPDHESIIGQRRPAFSLPGMAGEQHAISEWDGDILAINFWATWCQPCKEEVPEFVELQEKYRDRGVTFIGVAIDEKAPVSKFMARYDMNYPVLIGEQAAIDAARAYGNRIGALPYTAFVDRDGKVVHVHRGRLPLEEADSILSELVGASG